MHLKEPTAISTRFVVVFLFVLGRSSQYNNVKYFYGAVNKASLVKLCQRQCVLTGACRHT